jgi:hypothetical protein
MMITMKTVTTLSYYAVFCCLTATAALLFHLNPDNFIADDAYFYLQIADQIAQGRGSTFHQITPTNGYHPLWMLCCAAGAWLTGGNKEWLLHLMAVFQVGLWALSAWLLVKIAQQIKSSFLSAGIALLTFFLLIVGGLRLFEAHLAITLQLTASLLFLHLFSQSKPLKEYILFGSLLGLIFLARTDALFFSASCGVILGLNVLATPSLEGRRRSIILAMTLPPLLIASAYMGTNLWFFGHAVPISGVIKSTFPHMNFHWDALGDHGRWIVGTAIFLLLASVLMSRKDQRACCFFAMGTIAVTLHALYVCCFAWASQWHFTTAYAFLPICLSFLLTECQQRLPKKAQTLFSALAHGCTLTLFALAVTIGYLKTQYNFSLYMWVSGRQQLNKNITDSPGKQIAQTLNRYLPRGTRVFVYDAPGVIAYYSHVHILPVDGLINDWDYDREIVDEGIASYLKRQNISHFIAPLFTESQFHHTMGLKGYRKRNTQFFTVYAPVSKQNAGNLAMIDEKIIFTAPHPTPGLTKDVDRVACWKIAE